MSIESKPNQLVVDALRTLVHQISKQRTEIIVKRDDTKYMEGPYLLLANHVHNWDPIYLNLVVREPISFIAAESLFRIPMLKQVLNYLGTIPKRKSQNDTRTIRAILRAKKANRIIGIFPEGNRNWDGVTEPLDLSTAKLAKLLDIPVVIGTIKGGYLSKPRWAVQQRKGPVYISLVKAFDRGAFKQDKADVVLEKLTAAIHYDEMAWQAKKQIAYPQKSLANYLERLLFICPHCNTIGEMHSHKDVFYCKQCGYTVSYTTHGFFEAKRYPLIHQTPASWRKWQLDYLTKMIQKVPFSVGKMQDEVKFSAAEENERLHTSAKGKLTLHVDEKEAYVSFQPKDQNHTFRFPLEQMSGLNVHLHHMLEFYMDKTMFRMTFYNPRTSAYKWLTVIQRLLKESNK